MNFEDFDLLLTDPPAVHVIESPLDEKCGPFPIELDVDQLAVRYQRLLNRFIAEEEVKSLGNALFQGLFFDDVLALFLESIGQTRGNGKGMRLRLHLESTALARLPWELLFTKREGFLATNPAFSLFRYMAVPHAETTLPIDLPIRLLVLVSTPQGLPGLNAEAEQRSIQTALESMSTTGGVQIDFETEANREHLLGRLQREVFHAVHFIGHGDRGEHGGLIYLETEEQQPDPLEAPAFAEMLAACPSLRLVTLNACSTATENTGTGFSSTAAELIRRGIPGVIAMSSAVEDRVAISFSRHLYGSLASGDGVDIALMRARQQIRLDGRSHPCSFALPVLYLHTPDGSLFSISSARQKMLARISQEILQLNETSEALAEWKELHDILHMLSHPLELVYGMAANPFGASLIPSIWMQFHQTLDGKLLPFAERARFTGRPYQDTGQEHSGEEWAVRSIELARGIDEAISGGNMPLVQESTSQLRGLCTKHLTLCNRKMVDLLEQVKAAYQEARDSLDELHTETTQASGLNWQAILDDLTALGESSSRISEWIRLHDLFDRLHVQFATIVANASLTNGVNLLADPWARLRDTLVLELLDQARQISHIGKAYAELPDGNIQGELWVIDVKRKSDQLDHELQNTGGQTLERARQTILELDSLINQHYLMVNGKIRDEMSVFNRRGIALQARVTQ